MLRTKDDIGKLTQCSLLSCTIKNCGQPNSETPVNSTAWLFNIHKIWQSAGCCRDLENPTHQPFLPKLSMHPHHMYSLGKTFFFAKGNS